MLATKAQGLKVIVGLGRTGFACARYFTRLSVPVAVTDTREHPPYLEQLQTECPTAIVSVGGLDKKLFAHAEEIIISPGVSLKESLVSEYIEKGVPVFGDVELFARAAKAPICAITGSNAKSTVTSLTVAMAQSAGLNVRYGGNIGVPVVDLLKSTEPDLYILELSSFQLEALTSLHPVAATILNISPDHLDRYAHYQDYINAKQRIYRGCQFAIWNRDDPNTKPETISTNTNLISFGLGNPNSSDFGLLPSDAGLYLSFGEERLISVNELYIKGRHNWINALAALALGYALTLPMPAMVQALQNFKGLPHRCQWVAKKKGICWYNDSKGTNVGASIAAIMGLGSGILGKVILIAGGQAKGAEFSDLRQPILDYVSTVILMGKDAPRLEKALLNTVLILHAKDMQEAVRLAHQKAQEGDAILLSPACASFDMFDSFEHRGEVYMQAVKEELQ